jgi:hypothetical protein
MTDCKLAIGTQSGVTGACKWVNTNFDTLENIENFWEYFEQFTQYDGTEMSDPFGLNPNWKFLKYRRPNQNKWIYLNSCSFQI